jgi:hypothetical protein
MSMGCKPPDVCAGELCIEAFDDLPHLRSALAAAWIIPILHLSIELVQALAFLRR